MQAFLIQIFNNFFNNSLIYQNKMKNIFSMNTASKQLQANR
jgi:hypothetical protein